MATYKELIKRSLRLIQAIPKGDFEPDQGELADAFVTLGHLFDEMSSERWGQYTIVRESVTLTASDNEYSIGSTGDFATARPKKILKAYIRDNGIDYPIEIIQRERYAEVPDKTTIGRPYYLYYEEQYPNGRINVYPSPDQAHTMFIESWKELTKPTATTDTVNLPSEYVQFIVNELAVQMAPEYGTEAAPSVQRNSQLARRRLKNIHASNVPRANSDPFGDTFYYEVEGDYWV